MRKYATSLAGSDSSRLQSGKAGELLQRFGLVLAIVLIAASCTSHQPKERPFSLIKGINTEEQAANDGELDLETATDSEVSPGVTAVEIL